MDNPQPIRTLFLDAGGVLVFPNWNRIAGALASRGFEVTADALARADLLARRDLDEAAIVGGTDDRKRGWLYFNLVLSRAGLEQDARSDAALEELRAYHDSQNLWELVPLDVPAALARLRRLGLTMVVVSNANGQLVQLFTRLGLAPFFDVMLDSAVEGVEKPDPRLFQIALERSGSRPETTLHVGDLYHVDVVGARAAGLRATLLDPAGLYEAYDCPRVRSLGELADSLDGK